MGDGQLYLTAFVHFTGVDESSQHKSWCMCKHRTTPKFSTSWSQLIATWAPKTSRWSWLFGFKDTHPCSRDRHCLAEPTKAWPWVWEHLTVCILRHERDTLRLPRITTRPQHSRLATVAILENTLWIISRCGYASLPLENAHNAFVITD